MKFESYYSEILDKTVLKKSIIKKYLEQSIYVREIYQEKELNLGLNLIDGNIYFYFVDKSPISNFDEILPNEEFVKNGNLFYKDIKGFDSDSLIKYFSSLLEKFDNFLLQLNVKNQKVKTELKGYYSDIDNNKIIAPTNLTNSYFRFNGKNNIIEIAPNANLKNVYIECVGNNNKIIIGNNVRMTGVWRLGFNSQLNIGDNSSSTNPVYMTCAESSKIIIGKDCMFATNNQIRTDDSHAIYDVKTGQRLNYPKDIILGDHVWVAYGATLLGGTKIGSGSIIGAYSLVKKEFPNNCIIAGIPAKLIKKDIFWERPNLLNMESDIGFSLEEVSMKPYANLSI